MAKRFLYLDNSATTQIHSDVLNAMLVYLMEEYGNPAGKYYNLAENAKNAVNESREQIAALLKCEPEEVIFTSGATESNNMIIKGVVDHYQNKGKHVITTQVEHPSVIETCKYIESKGNKVTFLSVDNYGRISLAQLEETIISDKPILVSIIWGNNELGSLNDLYTIAEICNKYDIFLHTDATQVIGKIDVDLEQNPGIKFLSCSAHKIFGPKGIGAAIIRKHRLGFNTKITPLLHGGGQEMDYRSGTLAVPNIVGFGMSAVLAKKDLKANIRKLECLEQNCKDLLIKKFGDKLTFNNDDQNKVPGIISAQISGINNELFIKKVAQEVALSTGSACSSAKPSHVLQAVGKTKEEIRSTIRISLSPFINVEDLAILAELNIS